MGRWVFLQQSVLEIFWAVNKIEVLNMKKFNDFLWKHEHWYYIFNSFLWGIIIWIITALVPFFKEEMNFTMTFTMAFVSWCIGFLLAVYFRWREKYKRSSKLNN